MNTESFIISGTHSGVGKTTCSIALMTLLASQNFNVQPFKVGPDFIDPTHHKAATGNASINLDLWMMGLSQVRRVFRAYSKGKDISIIEGVGALFDGKNGISDHGSTAYLAKKLNIPVLLVIDIYGCARSAGALIKGYIEFDKEVTYKGILLNRAGSKKHADMVTESLPPPYKNLVVGYILRSEELHIPERHLGLHLSTEDNFRVNRQKFIIESLSKTIDLSKVYPEQKNSLSVRPHSNKNIKVRIGVPYDRSFSFYYVENLKYLERYGAEIVYFDLIADSKIPDEIDGLYIGGGYPENCANEISNNLSMRSSIRHFGEAGKPIYAECGGLMLLSENIKTFDGKRYPMVGLFPFKVEMDTKYLAIRYVEVTTVTKTILGPKHTKIRGQEFHQSQIVSTTTNHDLSYEVKTSSGEVYHEGFTVYNTLASYIHLYFGSNPSTSKSFLQLCEGLK